MVVVKLLQVTGPRGGYGSMHKLVRCDHINPLSRQQLTILTISSVSSGLIFTKVEEALRAFSQATGGSAFVSESEPY
jgi:hypothetical protein